MSSVTFEAVTKRIGKQAVVDGLNLTVRDGQFAVLVGPSGCGKTTTLRLLAGLDTPTAGRILLDGTDVTDLPPAKRDVAMVFQNYALYPHMTVEENMSFGLRMRKVPREEIHTKVTRTAAMLGMSSVLHRKPRELSGGQRQRVALGRAIVRDPKVFLLDEPLSNVDAKLRNKMRKELRSLFRELNATVVYVTHDQLEAMTMGDEIVVMHDGRVQQAGSPDEVYRNPANTFVAGFLGSPPMNLLAAMDCGAGRLQIGQTIDVTVPQAIQRWLHESRAATVTVGVRPEDVALSRAGSDAPAVELVENLGGEAIVHVQTGAESLSARIPGDHSFKPGDFVSVVLDPQKICFFDSASGQRLSATSP